MLRTPPPQALNTYLLTITTNPVLNLAPTLMRLAVSSRYAVAGYIQLHSASSLPADGAVPIGEPIAIAANGAFVRNWQPQGLPINSPGLVIVFSSTAATLTKVVAATVDIEADVEEYETRKPSATVVGDLTTAVRSLEVWTEASGASAPNRLLKIEAKNLVAAVRYLGIFAVNSPVAASNLISWVKFGASENKEFVFGMDNGLSPFQQDAITGTTHLGCAILALDTISPFLAADSDDFNIRATKLLA